MSLGVAGNEIKELDDRTFDNLVNLRELFLNKNKLSRLSKTLFKNCKEMTHLGLAWNEIIEIEYKTFDYLVNLKELYLQNNKLVENNPL